MEDMSAFWEAAEEVISGKAFGKGSTPESVNAIREVLAAYDTVVTKICQAFDQHLKNGRMNGTKVINRDYLPGVPFFRNPKGWEDTPTANSAADVLAGLQNMLASKTGK